MHTIWKGSIAFGLVNIPIKLFSAIEDKNIRLRMLHKECSTPIRNGRICPACDMELELADIIKGYEYVKGKFIILSPEELNALKEVHEERNIEILDFVDLAEIDPIYFDKSYYIGPGENGNKAYALLREALKRSGKIGVATITIRAKQQMVVVRVYKDTLLMETMHYPDEIRTEVPVGVDVSINDKELQTAIMLIDQLTTKFDPEKYQDDYRVALIELIQRKIESNEGVAAKDTKQSNVVDIMSALQASLRKSDPRQSQEL